MMESARQRWHAWLIKNRHDNPIKTFKGLTTTLAPGAAVAVFETENGDILEAVAAETLRALAIFRDDVSDEFNRGSELSLAHWTTAQKQIDMLKEALCVFRLRDGVGDLPAEQVKNSIYPTNRDPASLGADAIRKMRDSVSEIEETRKLIDKYFWAPLRLKKTRPGYKPPQTLPEGPKRSKKREGPQPG